MAVREILCIIDYFGGGAGTRLYPTGQSYVLFSVVPYWQASTAFIDIPC